MIEISDTEAVLLGLLYDSPKYGYEIDKIIEEQSMRDWTEIAFSSIYYTLKNLEKKGYVDSQLTASDKNRTRKIFSITSTGKNLLENCVRKKISEVKYAKWPVDIGLAYMDILPQDEKIHHLQEYRESLSKAVKCYLELRLFLIDHGCPLNRLQLAERPIIIYQAEIQWVDQFITQLQKKQE